MKVTRTKLWHLFFHTWKMNNIDQVAFQFCQSSFGLAQIKVSNILLNNLKPKNFWENFQFPQASIIDLANKTLTLLFCTWHLSFWPRFYIVRTILVTKIPFWKIEKLRSVRSTECQYSALYYGVSERNSFTNQENMYRCYLTSYFLSHKTM